MSSLLPGYEYDIFISYRHNDNRSGWVTEFVTALQEELASTIKDSVSVYFDTNPHDGLLETHNVNKSLEGKLKCLIFIPIISQTYCDLKSFAWQHEFCAFNKLAKEDPFGRDVKLANGNVASRILPMKIHDLDAEDKSVLEHELGGVLRGIEFIYKEPGVNRPLRASDSKGDNLNKTDYRNQVNKVANAIKEIAASLKDLTSSSVQITGPGSHMDQSHFKDHQPGSRRKKSSIILLAILFLGAAGYFLVQTFFPLSKDESAIDRSIAVLPFVDMSPNKDQEYFSDGLSDELINLLSKVPELKVIARTSSFSFKDKNEDARTIGNKLGVAHLLEGSVQKSGNKLRIIVQLVKSSDGSHLWSETYNSDMDEIFKVQDEIAGAVVRKLRVAMLGPLDTPSARIGNKKAYELFLRGKFLYDRAGPGDITKSLHYLDEAISLDSNNALIRSYWWYIKLYFSPNLDSSRREAEKILELDPSLAEAHFNRGYQYALDLNYEAANEEHVKALALDNSNPRILRAVERSFLFVGRFKEATELVERAIELDPLIPHNYYGLALCSMYTGQLIKAKEAYAKILELSPDYLFSAREEIQLHVLMSDAKAALLCAERESHPLYKLFEQALYYQLIGKPVQAQQMLGQLMAAPKTKDFSYYYPALVYAYRKEPDKAVACLEKAFQLKDGAMLWRLKTDPFMKDMRKDPRVKSMIAKLNFPD